MNKTSVTIRSIVSACAVCLLVATSLSGNAQAAAAGTQAAADARITDGQAAQGRNDGQGSSAPAATSVHQPALPPLGAAGFGWG